MPDKYGRMRVTLKFNDFDFRHQKVVDAIRAHSRNMTEYVATAILHYISCPNAGDEFSKIFVKDIVKEVIAEMMEEGTLMQPALMLTPESKDNAQEVQDLGDMMSAFR